MTPPVVDESDHEYLPEPAVEWVVDVTFEGRPKLSPEHIHRLTDEIRGMTAFGRDVAKGRWTFLISADGPSAVDDLKVAFDFVGPLDPDAPPTPAAVFEQRLETIRERFKTLGKLTGTANVSAADAARRAQTLHDLRRTCDQWIVIVVKAPEGRTFDGRTAWDVMLCLGLEWGDVDCFHWRNRSEVGDDSFFSVETSTPPGYFLPEEIAADRVHVEDLRFVYSVTRSARPVEVFDAMSRAANYRQKRLGGTVVVEGVTLDRGALRKEIVRTVERMRKEGFEPGTVPALRLF